MQHHFIDKTKISGDYIKITGPKFNHLKNVLRLSPGERLNFFDGEFEYAGEILEISRGEIKAKILNREPVAEKGPEVWLAQALPKAGKMDLIVREISQLGAAGIMPFVSQNCENRLEPSGEKADRRQAHWREIAISAAEQSGRGRLLKIIKPEDVKKLAAALGDFDQVILLWEKSLTGIRQFLFEKYFSDNFSPSRLKNNSLHNKILIMVGPEGGFTETEAAILLGQKNVTAVSLGKNILRTETAAVVAVALVLFARGLLG